MQTFPKLQRDSFIKKILKNLFFLVFYIFYIVLSSLYIFFPPLLGVLFSKYIKDVKNMDILGITSVFIAVLFFEILKSDTIGIVFLMYVLLAFITHRIGSVLQEETAFFRLIYIFFPYVFYFFILQCLTIFKSEPPMHFDILFLWYFIVESVIVIWKK